ncbi:MAG: DUF6176 family protein [Bacteroidales bacterium]
MHHVCVAFPVLPGRSEGARAFMRQLDAERRSEYDQSERRIGITKEAWFLAALPSGDHLIGYMESPDFQSAFGQFSTSRHAFDIWFKQEFLQATGFDFEHPPADMAMPELLSFYQPGTAAL